MFLYYLSLVLSPSFFLKEHIPITFHPLFSKGTQIHLFGKSFQFTIKFVNIPLTLLNKEIYLIFQHIFFFLFRSFCSSREIQECFLVKSSVLSRFSLAQIYPSAGWYQLNHTLKNSLTFYRMELQTHHHLPHKSLNHAVLGGKKKKKRSRLWGLKNDK